MLTSASTTRSAPTAAPAAPATTAEAIRSLITGGTPRAYPAATSAPGPAPGAHRGGDPVVDHRRDAADVPDVDLGAGAGHGVPDQPGDQLGGLPPGLAVEDPDRAAGVPLAGDGVEGLAGVHRAPHHRDAGP